MAAQTPPLIEQIVLSSSTQALVRAKHLVRTRNYDVLSTDTLTSGVWTTNSSWISTSSSTNITVTVSTNQPFIRLMLK
jgi:hypothetical protein